jgi:hypothetical protein
MFEKFSDHELLIIDAILYLFDQQESYNDYRVLEYFNFEWREDYRKIIEDIRYECQKRMKEKEENKFSNPKRFLEI